MLSLQRSSIIRTRSYLHSPLTQHLQNTRRHFWSPKSAYNLSKVASRVLLTAGGTTVATTAYYGQKFKEWGEDKRDKLAEFISNIELPGFDFSPSFPVKVRNASLDDSSPVSTNTSGDDHQNNNDSPNENSSRIVNSTNFKGKDFLALTKQLIEVRNILKSVDKDSSMSLPAIVVIGSQSSGKSSLLEALIGHDILPKGSNMVTRRPVEITLVNINDNQKEYAEFPRHGLFKIQDLSRVKDIVSELNDSVSDEECISDDPIDLRIYSPNVPDLTLIDLPGYIAVSNKNQPAILKQKIVNVCRKYIQEPNIILAVCAADVDLANSESLNEARQVDPYGIRTIGAITKMDLVQPLKGISLIQNQDYPLHLGYYGVISRDSNSRAKSDSDKYRQILTSEEKYYRQNADTFSPVVDRLGIPSLKNTLIKVLEEHLKRSLKHIVNTVRSELEEARYQFKVHFNDHIISGEAYTTEVLDKIKLDFRKLSENYNRSFLRQQLQTILDGRVVEICSEIYWDKLANSKDFIDDNAAIAALSKAQAQLTRGGIGRLCTQKVVDVLSLAINEQVLDQEPISYHTDAQKKLKELACEMLKGKVYTTVDQVENVLKPFKYDVDFTQAEWNDAMQHASDCLQKELEKSKSSLNELKNTVGWKTLRNAMQFIEKTNSTLISKPSSPTPAKDLPTQFSQKTLAMAQEALLLQKRIKILQERLVALQPYSIFWNWYPKCSTSKIFAKDGQDKQNGEGMKDCISKECPEPYLFLIADKMSQIAVTFIWIELLNELFYQYPREVDNRLYYQLDKDKLLDFANENPAVRQHLKLQSKKIALEKAMEKLMLVYLFQSSPSS